LRKEESTMLSRKEIQKALARWNEAWTNHDLDGVMALFHEDIIFDNWTGGKAKGRDNLRKAWEPWFKNHGGFRFHEEDLFVDETQQKVLFQWTLEWPSTEKGHQGRPEKRRGVDVLHFKDGKIVSKSTYSKTTLEVDGKRVKLVAE
jgi:ketosteroid isomerase-like protein